MKIQDIACDKEYSQKLKELGLNSKSLFFHHKEGVYCSAFDTMPMGNIGACWAYTVAELGEMLPTRIFKEMGGEVRELSLKCFREGCSGKFSLCYQELIDENVSYFYSLSTTGNLDAKEANARAKLLIYLIENNHINAEDLNK